MKCALVLLVLAACQVPKPVEVVQDQELIELEHPIAREPDDGTFARPLVTRWASGGECLVAFFGEGRATWSFEPVQGEVTLWLRYACKGPVRLPFAWGEDELSEVVLPATGATSGKGAWRWAALDRRRLDAGTTTFTLGAAPVRLDCAVVGGTAPPTHLDPRPAPPLSAAEASALAQPLVEASPGWLRELASLAPPSWYDRTRLCLHTRLGPPWIEREEFRAAEAHFAALGARSYVRHVRTQGEGSWWPSEAAVDAPWAESHPVEGMVARAKEHGLRFVAYYRHLEDVELAASHPEWCCRDERGRVLAGRGGAPRVCLNSPYLGRLEARLLELAALGVDGIYFDEDHMPREGCWCGYCARGFEGSSGLDLPEGADPEDPRYRRLVTFGALSMERAFVRLRRSLKAERPDLALLIGSNRAPDPLERFGSDRLWRLADGVKTEYGIGHSVRVRAFDSDLPRDVWLALGWTYCRDAAEGRPPHVWCNGLTDPRMAQAAAAAVIVHGGVANLDVKETRIPDAPVFADAVALGNALSDALAGATLERWAAIHWPDALRGELVTQEEVYTRIAEPMATQFAAFLWSRRPVGIVTDSLLAEGRLEGYKALFLTAPEALTPAQREQVAAFRSRGGAVHERGSDEDFYVGRLPDWRVRGGTFRAHVVAYRAPDGALLIAMTNDPGWVYTGPRTDRGGRPLRLPEGVDVAPPACEGVRVEVPEGTRSAVEVLTGVELPIEDGVVHLPAFQYAAVLRLE